MTLPSLEAQRSRETAMQAERHWFISRLQEFADEWREVAQRNFARTTILDDTDEVARSGARSAVFEYCAHHIEALIAERTK